MRIVNICPSCEFQSPRRKAYGLTQNSTPATQIGLEQRVAATPVKERIPEAEELNIEIVTTSD